MQFVPYRSHDINPYNKMAEWVITHSEYETWGERGNSITHCGWNAMGVPLPGLVNNDYLLDSNDYTKYLGVKKGN